MKPAKTRYLKLLFTYIKPQMRLVLPLFLLLGISIGLQLANPQIIRFFIDEAMNGTNSQRLYGAAALFITFALLQQGINLVATFLSQNIGWLTTNKLRLDLTEHCLKLDMSFHKSHRPGELIERIDSDISALFNFFSRLAINLINNGLLVIGILVLLFREDWRIGTALTAFAACTLMVLWTTQAAAVKYWVSERKANADFFGFLGEQIASTEDIRSNGAVAYVMNNFFKLIRSWYPVRKKAILMHYRMWITSLSIFAIGNMISFGIGAYLKINGIITIGTVYLIFNYTELLRGPLEQIRGQLQDFQKAAASIERIEELLAVKSALIDGEKIVNKSQCMELRVDKLTFQYDDNSPVLKDITFKVNGGETLGILGRTGSGKSTLARLLVRLYDPISGSIYLDDYALKEIEQSSLREKIAFVTQDVQLFNGSIRDNLTLFNPGILDEDISEAINSIGLRSWIENMPQGLETMLGPGGAGLSAGEAQLLAFIRVFLKNPSLIIMDEASSRLDPATEQLIEGAMNKLLEGRSCIIIAHRLHTVQRAHQILILEQGTIKEYGEREKLLSNPDSHFNKLLKTGLEEVLA
jgi:ATP-binding cassette, subfamily B, bacterial